MISEPMTKPKLTLNMMSGKNMTAEKAAAMYERMMGKKVTPEELEEGRAILSGGSMRPQ